METSLAQLSSYPPYSLIEDAINEINKYQSAWWETDLSTTVSTPSKSFGKKSSKSNKKRPKNKMQKQSRRQNRSSKK